jgi:hypothetical protein
LSGPFFIKNPGVSADSTAAIGAFQFAPKPSSVTSASTFPASKTLSRKTIPKARNDA